MRLPVVPERLNYLPILAVAVILDRYVSYFFGTQGLVAGQPAGVITLFGFFGLALYAWFRQATVRPATGALSLFLWTLTLAWIVHLVLYRVHGDAFNYTAFLYVPILLMIWLKPPDASQVRMAILAFAWTTSLVLVLTRLLEMFGALEIKAQSEGVINFDEERYFLPLNDFLGIDGRWPGPFGHNGDTAMMGAFLIVIAIGFWSRSSWIFISVGAFTLALTDGRASIGAAIAGLIVMWMFTRSRRIAWAPQWARLLTGTGALMLGALVMFLRPAGLTGRERIWPAFLDLWWQSPWIGVGGSGFATGNEITKQFTHAHSLYVEELARSGLVGFLTQFFALGIGVFIAARAARIGYSGPLAVMAAYFVTGITEPRNNWIVPSATWFLLIMMILAASAHLSMVRNQANGTRAPSTPSHGTRT